MFPGPPTYLYMFPPQFRGENCRGRPRPGHGVRGAQGRTKFLAASRRHTWRMRAKLRCNLCWVEATDLSSGGTPPTALESIWEKMDLAEGPMPPHESNAAGRKSQPLAAHADLYLATLRDSVALRKASALSRFQGCVAVWRVCTQVKSMATSFPPFHARRSRSAGRKASWSGSCATAGAGEGGGGCGAAEEEEEEEEDAGGWCVEVGGGRGASRMKAMLPA